MEEGVRVGLQEEAQLLHWVLKLLDLNTALGNGRWGPCRFRGQEQKAAVGGSEKH